MTIKVLRECGYEEALLGLSLSYKVKDRGRMPEVAERIAGKDGGENKFLESIAVWLDITAPLSWWMQFDTYRVGVTKQSESKMHTLCKRELVADDFEDGRVSAAALEEVNKLIRAGRLEEANESVPLGFLQRRVVCTNYKALRHAYHQRINHRMALWRLFCSTLVSSLEHPSFVAKRG